LEERLFRSASFRISGAGRGERKKEKKKYGEGRGL
jgi:hypothetical protein